MVWRHPEKFWNILKVWKLMKGHKMSWLVWNVLKGPKRHWKGSLICIEMSWKVFDVKRFWMVVKGVLKGLLKGLEKSWKGQKMSWNVRKCTRISERSLNSRRYGMLCVLVFFGTLFLLLYSVYVSTLSTLQLSAC